MKTFKSFIKEGENKQVKGGDPCWSGYEMVGKKKKNGREVDRKSTRLNSSHSQQSRMPSSA